jgi:hypothetical protein
MDVVPGKPVPPLAEVIHLVFMYHETNAYSAHGSPEKTSLLRAQERMLYECHGVSRQTVESYAAAYDRETVLSFFRTDPAYLELERAFMRAPNEKFNILKGLTSFTSATRIDGKHVRTIPVADYPRATAALNALPREHRHN